MSNFKFLQSDPAFAPFGSVAMAAEKPPLRQPFGLMPLAAGEARGTV